MAYRILSLDVGGSWAMLQAMALDDIYPGKSGHQVLADFDMAVANSGGSIVLAGLMLDRSPADMVQLFRTQVSTVFVHGNVFNALFALLKLPLPKYSTQGKLAGLKAVLGPGVLQPMSAWAGPLGPSGEPVKALITA